MLMMSRAIACGFLLFTPCVCAQSSPLDRRATDFHSKGVGLTETLLKFSHQEHLPIAIEYVDRASMDQPIDVSLRNKTIRQALHSILRKGNGYSWRSRNRIVEITNRHASKRADDQLNRVISVFKISEGADVQMTSSMLWWQLQIELDPNLKGKGFLGHSMGSSTIKPTTLHHRTVREILSYIVLNSQAEGWTVAGPPECLGFTPHCGLWYMIEGEPSDDSSNKFLLQKIRKNL